MITIKINRQYNFLTKVVGIKVESGLFHRSMNCTYEFRNYGLTKYLTSFFCLKKLLPRIHKLKRQ
jgi:hypothetical protein